MRGHPLPPHPEAQVTQGPSRRLVLSPPCVPMTWCRGRCLRRATCWPVSRPPSLQSHQLRDLEDQGHPPPHQESPISRADPLRSPTCLAAPSPWRRHKSRQLLRRAAVTCPHGRAAGAGPSSAGCAAATNHAPPRSPLVLLGARLKPGHSCLIRKSSGPWGFSCSPSTPHGPGSGFQGWVAPGLGTPTRPVGTVQVWQSSLQADASVIRGTVARSGFPSRSDPAGRDGRRARTWVVRRA